MQPMLPYPRRSRFTPNRGSYRRYEKEHLSKAGNFVKSLEAVMPDPGASPGQALIRHPEHIDPPEADWIPAFASACAVPAPRRGRQGHSQAGRNDEKRRKSTFFESINL